jgi:hypothetical protein
MNLLTLLPPFLERGRRSLGKLLFALDNLFPRSDAMQTFLTRHRDEIKGVLSGFDRIRFRGTLRWFEVLQVARTVHSLISGQPVDSRTPPG